MSDRGVDSWADDLSARERVREIAMTLTEPRSVEWVRTEARVSSWQTAKDELEMLVDFGQVQAVEGGDGHTKYAPNYQRRYFKEIADLINNHTRDALRDEIASIQAALDEWKRQFDVESRDELESTLTDEGLTTEEIQARNRVLRQWERYEDNKRLLKHALELYDDARALHPRQSDPSDAPVRRS